MLMQLVKFKFYGTTQVRKVMRLGMKLELPDQKCLIPVPAKDTSFCHLNSSGNAGFRRSRRLTVEEDWIAIRTLRASSISKGLFAMDTELKSVPRRETGGHSSRRDFTELQDGVSSKLPLSAAIVTPRKRFSFSANGEPTQICHSCQSAAEPLLAEGDTATAAGALVDRQCHHCRCRATTSPIFKASPTIFRLVCSF